MTMLVGKHTHDMLECTVYLPVRKQRTGRGGGRKGERGRKRDAAKEKDRQGRRKVRAEEGEREIEFFFFF